MHQHTMRDGRTIPAMGYGTYPMDDAESEANVAEAVRRGYRLIDTAAQYGNEVGVGRGIAASGVPREELVVTTKLAGKDHGYDATKAACKESLRKLGLDYVDLYLIHWPNPSVDLYVESWQAMLDLQKEGLIASVGTSNFLPEHIDRLREETGEYPVVNQAELQITAQQEPLRAYHEEHRIITESWSPLGRMSALKDVAAVQDIARDLEVAPAQVVLRWQVQSHLVPIPKTSSPERMDQNLDVFSWSLTEDQMDQLHLAHTGIAAKGYDPRTHEEF